MQSPTSYSLAQKALHWSMALLIFYNLLLTEGIENWADAADEGRVLTAPEVSSANLHAYIGIAILALAVVRLIVRFAQGAPEAPADEPALAKIAGKLGHGALYLLFFLMPLAGIGKYYFDIDFLGDLHAEIFKVLLWVIIIAHVAASLVHHFIWKTDVLKRMTHG